MKSLCLPFPIIRHAALAVLALLVLRPEPASAAEADEFSYTPPAAGSYFLPVVKRAADGAVLESSGRPARLAAFTRGRITVMSFIYTRCSAAKACPYATGVLLDLHQESDRDPELANALRLVSLSFDPQHDTPRRMADLSTIAAERPDAAPWHFLTTRSTSDLRPILRAYDQSVDRKKDAHDPTGPLHHMLRVFLIDAAGNVRNIYSSSTLDPRLVLADVRTLLREATLLSPAEAGAHAGRVATIGMRVATAARVTDITDPQAPRPLEVLLLDAANGDDPLTPTERSTIIVRLPVTTLTAFRARSMDELARRFEGKSIAVTGRVELEPHPAHALADGSPTQRPVITVHDPSQLRITP